MFVWHLTTLKFAADQVRGSLAALHIRCFVSTCWRAGCRRAYRRRNVLAASRIVCVRVVLSFLVSELGGDVCRTWRAGHKVFCSRASIVCRRGTRCKLCISNLCCDERADGRGPCDGVLLLLAQRARPKWPSARQRMRLRKTRFDGPWIPFGATVSCRPISSKHGARLHHFGKIDASRKLHGRCLTCGRRMARRFAHRGLPRPQEPVRLRNSRQTVQAEVAQEGKLLFPCADRPLKLFWNFLNPRAAKCAPRETLSKEPISKKESCEDLWSMSDDFINQKMYVR